MLSDQHTYLRTIGELLLTYFHSSQQYAGKSGTQFHSSQLGKVAFVPAMCWEKWNPVPLILFLGKVELSSICPSSVLGKVELSSICPSNVLGKVELSSIRPSNVLGKVELSSIRPSNVLGKVELSSIRPSSVLVNPTILFCRLACL